MKYLTKKQKDLIDQKIELNENKYIIRLNYMEADDPNRNVYCITANDEILWQIENDLEQKILPGGLDLDSFVHIKFDGKELIAHRFSGFTYSVDLEDGKIHRKGWHK